LIRDAFKASIGYILPRYLQDELAAVYSNEVICEEHDQIVTLAPIANDLICVTLRVQRKLRNISGNNHAFNPMLTVEEWLATGAHSKNHEVGYRKNGGVDVLPEKEVILHESAIPKLALHLPGTTMMPNDTIDLWFSFDEIKHRSDMHVLRFRYSTN